MKSSDIATLGFSPEQAALLERFGFDVATFRRLREELRQGSFRAARNQLAAVRIEPPQPLDLVPWPAPESPQRLQYEAAGGDAIKLGRVAVCILNGGMATRFGGTVKGVVEVADGCSFIGYKLTDIVSAPGRVTTFVMNSFATDGATREHLAAHRFFGLTAGQVHLIEQGISVRLTPAGEIFRGADGAPSFYAPGHGDLLTALRRAPGFAEFRASGGRYVLVSNVDNLGASLTPVVIGAHIVHARPVTVEVAARAVGDRGGAPARIDGHVQVVEGFRFPPDFEFESLPVFNTNTFVLDAAVVDQTYELTWLRADKEVDGAPVVQFERLLGEITAAVDATYLQVPRDGPEGRFLPVKTPADLNTIRPLVRQRFALPPSARKAGGR